MKRLILILLMALVSVPLVWAQDVGNSNNIELSNINNSKGWTLASTYTSGTTSISIQSGSGVPTVGSRFLLAQDQTHVDIYHVTAASGTGPVTLTICFEATASSCTGGLQATYNSGTVVYWLPDISTYKTISGCTPADITEICIGWTSAHNSDSRVIFSRAYLGSSGINPERWACAVADPCPLSGLAGDSVTAHAVKIKKVSPLLDSYGAGGTADNQVMGFWVASRRTDTLADSTLGHQVFAANGIGTLVTLVPSEAVPGNTFDFRLYTFGATSVYIGRAFPIQLALAKVGGVASSQTYLKTVVLNDGSDHTCTLTVKGGTCADGISFWFVASAQSYLFGSPSTDYLLTSSACGPTAPCVYNPDYDIGLSLFDNGAGGDSTKQQVYVWVKTTAGTTTPASYTLKITAQGNNGSFVDVGTPVTSNFTFIVLAIPTFTETKATSFPAIYSVINMQGFISYHSWKYCTSTTVSQLWLYSQGSFDNTNYPANNVGLFYYDGSREEFYNGDFVGSIATNWQASHSYPYGTMIKPTTGNAGGYVYYTYPTAGGPINGIATTSTSASSAPSWASAQAWGTTVDDGNGTSYFNVGTAQSHYQCAEANLDPFRNFLMVAETKIAQHSATANMGMLMDYYRTNDLKCDGDTTFGCAAGTTLVANDLNAIEQLYTSTGVDVGVGAYKLAAITDGYDIRSVADMVQYAVAGDFFTGMTDVMEETRIDSLLGILTQAITIQSYGNTDYLSNSFILGTSAKTLYNALIVEALINYYNKELLSNRYHPEIPTVVKAYLDWEWTNLWCTTPGADCDTTGYNAGSDAAFLYTGASWPPYQNFDLAETELNLLNATGFAWMYALTSDVTYLNRGDAVFGNSMNNPATMLSRKTLGQQRNFLDYIRLRDGTRVGTVNGHVYAPFGVFQDSNPCNSGEAFPCTKASTIGDATYPFNWNVTAGSRSGTPMIGTCGALGCVFQWNTPGPAPHNWVAYGTSTSNCNLLSADSTSNVKINDWTWQHIVTVANAASSTTYFAAPKSQSAAGVVAQERCNSSFNALYSFTTAASVNSNQGIKASGVQIK